MIQLELTLTINKMNTIEILLFTQYPDLLKIYKSSDGAYFVKLREVQAYALSIPGGTFLEISRPETLPPLPSTPIPVNEQWVKFPTLWQWKGDFSISENVQLLPVPALENRMWTYRITSTSGGAQSKELRWGTLESQKLVVGVGDFVMCTSDGWIKIENALRMSQLETSVATVIAQNAIIVNNGKGDTGLQGIQGIKGIDGNLFRGKKLYADEFFENGFNGVNVYDNIGSGTITHTLIPSPAGTPKNGGNVIEIKHTSANTSPAYGGFRLATQTRANATFVCQFKAKIPIGRTLIFTSNPFGDGGTAQFLTPQTGTGKWEDYTSIVKCGSTGTFGTTNFFYIDGGANPTVQNPLIWYLSSATVWDCDAINSSYLDSDINCTAILGKDGILTKKMFQICGYSDSFPLQEWGDSNLIWLRLFRTSANRMKFVTSNYGGQTFDFEGIYNFVNTLAVGNQTPHSSAVFDVASTSKGVLLPRMTTAQINAIATPAEGLEVYNLNLKKKCFFNGTAWQQITSTAM